VAAAAAPEAGNMHALSRHAFTERQLLQLLSRQSANQAPAAAAAAEAAGGVAARADGTAGPPPGATCGCFPALAAAAAPVLAAELSEAAAGQRPWPSAELQELLQSAAHGHTGGGGGSGGGKAAARRCDPAAFRERLASRFAAKSAVYDNCRMYSREGELLCHTGVQAAAAALLWFGRPPGAQPRQWPPLCTACGTASCASVIPLYRRSPEAGMVPQEGAGCEGGRRGRRPRPACACRYPLAFVQGHLLTGLCHPTLRV
jgi:hypothetical protein